MKYKIYKKGIKMNNIDNNKIMEFLYKFKNDSIYNNIIKVFLYKNITPVIEFKYKNRRFAFDVKVVNETDCLIKLCWRKESSHYATIKKITDRVYFKDLKKELTKNIEDVIQFINNFGDIKCSVIVPMHNSEKLIKPLLESLNNQTFEKKYFEVIFVDDASNDNTVNVVKNFSSNFKFRIIQRSTPSGNASAPRNEGIRLAYGDYVLFVDSDDYIANYTLEEAVEYAESNSSDMVFLKLAGINRSNVNARTYIGDNVDKANIIKHFLFNSFFPSKLIKTSLIRNNNIFYDQSFTKEEDKIFLITCMVFSKKISILREKKYIFLVGHEGEHLSAASEQNKNFRIFKLWTYGLSLILSSDDEKKKSDMYNAWLYRFCREFYNCFLEKQYNHYLFEIVKMFMMYENLFDINKIYNDGKSKVLYVISEYKQENNKFFRYASLYRNNKEIEKNNRILVIHDKYIEEVKEYPKLEVEFIGKCSLIEIHETIKIQNKIKITIGDNCFLHFDKFVSANNVCIDISASYSTMWVGENTKLNTINCICKNDNNLEIIIGKNVVFSPDVLLLPSDEYSIFNKQNKQPFNLTCFGIHIDDHVWIGQRVTILKDVSIPKNCIIEANSVVRKNKFIQNSIICGNPSEIIREEVDWSIKN